MNNQLLKQKQYSATIGFIIGDTLGVPVEFQARDELSQNPVTYMREFGTHNQPKGTWSDDTSMMLCTMEVLSNAQHLDNLIFGKLMDSFLAWRDEGYMTPHGKCFDIGIATNEALNRFKNGTSPLECGGDGEYDNGNGSLMRILPLAFYTVDMEIKVKSELVHNISALTHNHIRSKIACSFYVQMVQLMLDGVTKDEALAQTVEIITEFYKNECELSHFNRILSGNIANLTENEISSSGYVVHTLEAVLWCFMNSDNFKDSVLKAVNLGDDTDTVGALVGGIAGVYYGSELIPKEWINSLVKRSEIEKICDNYIHRKVYNVE